MNDHISDFLDEVEDTSAEATWRNRKSDLTQYEEWAEDHDISILDATTRDVHQFLRTQGREFSNSTVNSRYASTKQFYDYLETWDIIEESPMEDLDRTDYLSSNDTRKHQKADIMYVTPEEVEEMAEHAPSPALRNELVIRLLFQTGVRRGEAAKIKLEDVDRDRRAIDVWSTKTSEWRTVYYQPSLDVLMDQWLDGGYRSSFMPADSSEYLFVSQRADHISGHLVNRIVREAAKNAGIQEVMYEDGGGQKRYLITAHSLRHGHAVYALKSGIDLRTVQQHMGHSSIDITERYLQLLDEDIKEGYRRWGDTER